jgi:hypothetical protein
MIHSLLISPSIRGAALAALAWLSSATLPSLQPYCDLRFTEIAVARSPAVRSPMPWPLCLMPLVDLDLAAQRLVFCIEANRCIECSSCSVKGFSL